MTGLTTARRRAAGRGLLLPALLSLALLLLLVIGISSAADDFDVNKAFLDAKTEQKDVETLPSGLRYKVLKKGGGAYHPGVKTPVINDFKVSLIDGTVCDEGKEAEFGPDSVVKGWSEAMQWMVEGDRWEIYIPPHLGYGAKGSESKNVPANSVMIVEFHLKKIKGDKHFSGKCNIVTNEGCDDRMKKYIRRNLISVGNDLDFIDEEYESLKEAKEDKKDILTKSEEAWIDARMFIMLQFKMMSGGDLGADAEKLGVPRGPQEEEF